MFGVDYSTISNNRNRLKRELPDDRKIPGQFRESEQQIDYLLERKVCPPPIK